MDLNNISPGAFHEAFHTWFARELGCEILEASRCHTRYQPPSVWPRSAEALVTASGIVAEVLRQNPETTAITAAQFQEHSWTSDVLELHRLGASTDKQKLKIVNDVLAFLRQHGRYAEIIQLAKSIDEGEFNVSTPRH